MLQALVVACVVSAAPAAGPPVLVGLDLEYGHATSTSDDAITRGALIAVDEINRAGGVLGGRPLQLVERDNRSNPARGVEDLQELAALPDLVAVMGGKFSPVFIEQLPLAHQLDVILLDPWAAADVIVDNGRTPSFVFRLAMRDSWAVDALLGQARRRGLGRVGLLLSNTAWGRSCEAAAREWTAHHPGVRLAGTQWFNWGDETLLPRYRALREAGAQAVLLVANEGEGATLVRELARLPAAERLPILAHAGVTGGDFPAICGAALREVDLSVVQAFSFFRTRSPRAAAVLEAARRRFRLTGPEAISSPAGLAQAYDLVHILARAVDLAGTTDRRRVRDALERVRFGDGLVRRYGQPFSPTRHEALSPADLFLARWDARGVLVPLP
ncbi:MAG TPA: ABC transporter substrate-binding protein [Anaeromyxobacteraceae bacterium]|nr:ABC transporter substrate-binding protein [Anaeromyxobacteraceae bacterium]